VIKAFSNNLRIFIFVLSKNFQLNSFETTPTLRVSFNFPLCERKRKRTKKKSLSFLSHRIKKLDRKKVFSIYFRSTFFVYFLCARIWPNTAFDWREKRPSANRKGAGYSQWPPNHLTSDVNTCWAGFYSLFLSFLLHIQKVIRIFFVQFIRP